MHAATLSESQSPSSQSEGCVSRGYYATLLMKARWCISRHFANDLDASYLGRSPATFRHFPCCRQILQLPQFSICKHTEYQVMPSLTTLCSALTTTNHYLTPKERLVFQITTAESLMLSSGTSKRKKLSTTCETLSRRGFFNTPQLCSASPSHHHLGAGLVRFGWSPSVLPLTSTDLDRLGVAAKWDVLNIDQLPRKLYQSR